MLIQGVVPHTSLAKLVPVTPISLWHNGRYESNYLLHKATYNWGTTMHHPLSHRIESLLGKSKGFYHQFFVISNGSRFSLEPSH